MSSNNASYAITYTSISSDSDGPLWGILLMDVGELSEMDPYEEVAQQGQATPPLLADVPDPMELKHHVSVYVPDPVYLEYLVPSGDDISVKDHPYAIDASPTTLSLGYVTDSDLKEDPIDYVADDDEKEESFKDDDDYHTPPRRNREV
nr:hypothetical protein [Tanacetum cinerariifolium]